MPMLKGYSIFAHSWSSTSEVFALLITNYMQFEYRANKAAQIPYPFDVSEIPE